MATLGQGPSPCTMDNQGLVSEASGALPPQGGEGQPDAPRRQMSWTLVAPLPARRGAPTSNLTLVIRLLSVAKPPASGAVASSSTSQAIFIVNKKYGFYGLFIPSLSTGFSLPGRCVAPS